MGVILDSSLLIASERQSQPVSALLAGMQGAGFGDTAISSITIMELEHGFWRASTDIIARRRRVWLDEVLAICRIEPFTVEMARQAGRIDAELRQSGKVIAVPDLLIGVTALHLGFSIATLNVRHFREIPRLIVQI